MSKAFTKEGDAEEEDDFEEPDPLPASTKNYMTPHGFSAMQAELRTLQRDERPKVVEVVSWAAGNGDRSENGDYIYGKKRLREIDRRIRYIVKRLENSQVVDPARQQGLEQVFFGATVTYVTGDEKQHTVKLVGVDEADVSQGKISWISPLAKGLLKSRQGDSFELRTPGGVESIEVVKIAYLLE